MSNPSIYNYSLKLGLLFYITLCWLLLPCLSLTTFVFGDSLVDAGNNDYFFSLSKADSPPYGIDFLPSGGQPTGRFTNGRTVSDIIGTYYGILRILNYPLKVRTVAGQSLGAKSFPPPFLAPNSQINAIHVGINYASGSAGILLQTGSLFIGRIPLQDQVSYFEQTRAHIVDKMGEKATKKILKNAVFSLSIGSNDILNYIQPSVPFIGQEKVDPVIFLDMMLSNLTMQLKRLHKLGASKFVVVGIGPLGCIPFVRAIKLDLFKKCSNEVNELIQGYNQKLNTELSLLNQEMGKEAVYVYANSYDIFMDIISNYQDYGFENAKDPCCGGFFPPFTCFKVQNTNTSSELCEDRSKYVFWDAYHPTEAANLILAKKLLDGDQRFTSPVNIRQLYNHQN